MRFQSKSARLAALVSAFALIASTASAQATATLNGNIMELYPSGGTNGFTSLIIQRVAADGTTFFVKSISTCNGGQTTDCVASSGNNRTFSATNIPLGPVLVNLGGTGWTASSFSHQHTGGSVMDIVALPRLLNVTVNLGDVPAGGGFIPILVNVSRRWANPFPIDLPINIRVRYQRTNSTFGNDSQYNPLFSLDYTLPAAFTSVSNAPLGGFMVPATELAGSSHCLQVDIYFTGLPNTALATGVDCSNKRP